MRWKTSALLTLFLSFGLGLAYGAVDGGGFAQMRGGQDSPVMRGAQGRGGMSPEERRKQMQKSFEELLKYLELEKEKESQARKLFDNQQEAMKKLTEAMRKGNLDQGAARDSMQSVAADYRENFNNLLSPDQRKKLEEWSSSNARYGGAAGSGERGARPGWPR